KADFSQVELRIAAKVTRDKAMLDAYRSGADLHTLTAQRVIGAESVKKEQRQLAKALNFGLLYGMGARRVRDYAVSEYALNLTLQQAQEYRAGFFRTYSALATWHRTVGRSGKAPTETRTLTGRRSLDVCHFSEKLNLPIQGTGADGLKAA